jgi:hypothetical protein
MGNFVEHRASFRCSLDTDGVEKHADSPSVGDAVLSGQNF